MHSKILIPLGMLASTFDYSKVKHMVSMFQPIEADVFLQAVGKITLANGTSIPAPIENLGWGNPMGGMFSSAKDMSKFVRQKRNLIDFCRYLCCSAKTKLLIVRSWIVARLRSI